MVRKFLEILATLEISNSSLTSIHVGKRIRCQFGLVLIKKPQLILVSLAGLNGMRATDMNGKRLDELYVKEGQKFSKKGLTI